VRFSVIIPTFHRLEVLRETLDSLSDCDPSPEELILVDADPEAGARPLAQEVDGQNPTLSVRYIRAAPSLTTQRNRGIEEASGDVVVFLDDDVVVPMNMFEKLADAYKDAGIVGATGRIIEPEDRRVGSPRSAIRRWLPGGGREGEFTRYGYPRYLQTLDKPHDVEYMLGCFMTARLGAAAQVRFDERMDAYALGEDEDFAFRLSRLGRIRYLPDLVVHHHKLGFNSRDPREFGRDVVVNRAYLFRKNFRRTPLARAQFALLVLMLLGHRIVNRDWRGAAGLLRGTLDALRESE
jgi:glucosyl-dolichyl phosphate glucuronosyltransferase